MHNEGSTTYDAPQLRDLGSLTEVTEDGMVPKKGSTADQYTALGMGTGDLPVVP